MLGHRCLGTWRCGRPLFGAVVLGHEVLDAVDGRMIHKIPTAGSCRPAGAAGIGAQGIAKGCVLVGATQVECGGHVLGVAAQNLAVGTNCSMKSKQGHCLRLC